MDIVSSEVVHKYSVFSVRRLVVRISGDRKEQEFHIIQRADSVQIVAITEDGRFLMVEQERQGTQQPSLEFVAGLIDDGEAAEHAAARELEEETGFCAKQLHELGWYYTDPAILTNKVTVYLAEGCTRTGKMKQDEGEDVRSRLHHQHEIPDLMESGKITHGLVISAWHLYQRRVQRSRSRT